MDEAVEALTLAVDGDGGDGALFGPERLNAEESSRLLARAPGRLVVFMGERGSGKTALCVELYERQRRPGAGVRFAGSWTLLAFEQLAHRRRTSGSPPAAARDGLDPEGREILHLALSSDDVLLHLLLADLPGEVFRRLADCQLAASDVPWLGRADRLALLVDGERLSDASLRSSTLTRVRQLLERLQSEQLPGPEAGLALLVTKWDLVAADADAGAYWERREPELLADLRALDPNAVALRASAKPGADGLTALRAWLLGVTPARVAGATAAALVPPQPPDALQGPPPRRRRWSWGRRAR